MVVTYSLSLSPFSSASLTIPSVADDGRVASFPFPFSSSSLSEKKKAQCQGHLPFLFSSPFWFAFFSPLSEAAPLRATMRRILFPFPSPFVLSEELWHLSPPFPLPSPPFHYTFPPIEKKGVKKREKIYSLPISFSGGGKSRLSPSNAFLFLFFFSPIEEELVEIAPLPLSFFFSLPLHSS